jgi:hypothetical protein
LGTKCFTSLHFAACYRYEKSAENLVFPKDPMILSAGALGHLAADVLMMMPPPETIDDTKHLFIDCTVFVTEFARLTLHCASFDLCVPACLL